MIVSFRSVAAATLLFLCTACQKEISFDSASASGTAGGSVNGVLKMKIDGVQWAADRAAGASMISGRTGITGIGKDKKYIILSLSDTVTGTYLLYDTSYSAGILVDSSQAKPDPYTTNQSGDTTLAGGAVTITAIDRVNKTMSGSFKFKVYRITDSTGKKITEGVFEKLSYTTTLPAASSTDTLTVKTDGGQWTAQSIFAVTFGGGTLISGTASNLSRSVGLQVPAGVAAGTYDFTFFGDYIGTYAPDAVTTLMADPGKITIIEHNLTTKRIRGSFYFKAIPIPGTTGTTYNLTEGYFSVKTQ